MRENNEKKSGKFKIGPKSIGITLAAVIVLVLFGYWLSKAYRDPIFFVSEVRLNIEDDPDLEKLLFDNIDGRYIFDLDIRGLHKKIMNAHPEYRRVSILKAFPSTILIEIEKRKPFAVWKGRSYHLIDPEGIIIDDGEREPHSGFIAIEITNYPGRVEKGVKISDTRLTDAFRLLTQIEENNFFRNYPITSVNTTHPTSIYFTLNDIKIIIGEEDFSHRLHLLETVIKEQLKGDLTRVKYIDLRHKKVYIGFKR